ncbi:MAG: dodecin domain-containing protein [Methanobacteriota archaeon]|nr:MAG: dodecin domain-containing protein [Euryarchaeota archaeon]
MHDYDHDPSTYKIIEIVGTSTISWEDAAQNAVTQAAKSLRDLRIVRVVEMDAKIENGKIVLYRTRVKISFKFEN